MKTSKRKALEGTDPTQIIVKLNNDWRSYDSNQGVALIRSAIVRFPGNEFIQVAGLIALGDIARLDTPTTHFSRDDLAFVLEAAAASKEMPKVCAGALYAFGYISTRKAIVMRPERSCAACLVECITKYPERKDVQMCGMLALNALVLCECVAPLDAIPLACSAMTRFQQETEVQRKCYLIFGNACRMYNSHKNNDNDNNDNDDNNDNNDNNDEKEPISNNTNNTNNTNNDNDNNETIQNMIIEHVGVTNLFRGLGMPEAPENLFALSEITIGNKALIQQINSGEHISAILNAMKRNSSNPEAQRHGIITLTNIYRECPTSDAAATASVIETLAKLFKDQAANLPVIEPLAELTALLTDLSGEEGAQRFCAYYGFDNLLGTLGRYPSAAGLQALGLHIIHNTAAALPKSKVRKALDYAVAAMKRLPECGDVHYYAALTLSLIFSLEKPSIFDPSVYVSRAEAEGGIDAAIGALSTFRECERPFAAALHMLALCTHETLCGLEAGGTHEKEIDVIVANMSGPFFENEEVQFDGIRVLSNVAKDNPKNQGKVCFANGLQAVAKALGGYPDSEKIQFAGVKLLFFLAENNPLMQEEAERAKAAGADLVQISIAALNKYAKTNFKMALYCFLSLAWIAKGCPSGKREIILRRGIVAIVETMRSNLIFEDSPEDDDDNNAAAVGANNNNNNNGSSSNGNGGWNGTVVKQIKMNLFEKNVFIEYSCFALMHIIEGTSDTYAQFRESHGLNTFLGVLKDSQRSGNEKTQIDGCLGLVLTLAGMGDDLGGIDCRTSLCELGYPEVLTAIMCNAATPAATLEIAMGAFKNIMSGRRGLKSTEDSRQCCVRYATKIVAVLRRCGLAPAWARLAQLGFEVLATMAEGNEGRQIAVIAAGALAPAYAVLNSNKTGAELCESGVWLLRTLAETSDENRRRIGTDGVRCIAAAMTRHPGSRKIVEHGCNVLKQLLADNNEARAALTNYEVVTRAVELDEDVGEDTQKAAAYVLVAALERRGLVTQKDMAVAMKAMDKYLAHEDIQRLFCSFFAAITTPPQPNPQKKGSSDAGAVAAKNVQIVLGGGGGGGDGGTNAFGQAVTAMGLFQQDELIQERVLTLTINCAGAAGALMPADCKYIDAVFDSLAAHPQAASIRDLALTALMLAAENAEPAQTVRPRIAARDGIRFAIDMMRRAPGDQKVLAYACRLISRVAQHGNYTPAFAAACVSEILAALRFFSGPAEENQNENENENEKRGANGNENNAGPVAAKMDPEGVMFALTALGAVLAKSGAIEHLTALEPVTGPMAKYPKDDRLQEACCSVLACVIVPAGCPFGEARVKDAVRLTVIAMHNYSGNRAIQRYGCLVLAGAQKGIIDEGAGFSLVSKILNKFPESEEIQAACCKAFAHLTEGIATAAEGGEEGGSDPAAFRVDLAGLDGIIKKSMGRHAGSRAVQVYALKTLANLASQSNDMARKIAANSGIEAIILILGKHPDDAEVQSEGCHALSNISDHSTYGLRKMFALGGVDAVTSSMFKFKRPELQQWGCNIISKIIMHNLELAGSSGGNGGGGAGMTTLFDNGSANRSNSSSPSGSATADGGASRGGAVTANTVGAEVPSKKSPVDIRNREEMNRINYQVFIEGGGIEALVGALNEFPENEDLQRHNIFTLGTVALINPVNLRKICESNGVESVVAMLRRFGEDKELMAVVGLGALVKIVPKYADNQAALVRVDGIPLVIRLMTRHAACEEVQVSAAHILASCTSKSVELQRTVALSGGIEAVIAAMQRFPQSTQAQRWGCFALGNIASMAEDGADNTAADVPPEVPAGAGAGTAPAGERENGRAFQEQIRASNGIAAVLKAMRYRADLPQMQDNGCYALSKLVQGNDAAKEELGAADGIAVIVRAMSDHCLYEPVQRWGCAALGAALMNSPENQAKLAKCTYNDSPTGGSGNGVVILLMAMRRFPFSERVLANGIMGLISAISGPSLENLQAAAFSGGIELVVDTMKRFTESADIQRWGCIALRSLSSPLTQSRIGESDGIATIVAAIKGHPWDPDVLQWACLAISDITAGCTANQVRVRACNGVAAITTALSEHTDDVNVQRWGCYALGVCAANNPENSDRVGECGGVEAILTALERFPENEDVLRGGLYSLGVLAFHNDRNKARISAGVRHIISALNVDLASDEVIRSGCYALVTLSEGNVRSQQAIESFGGTEALIRIIGAHSGNSEILTLASAALRNVLSASKAAQSKFSVLDGTRTVLPILMEILGLPGGAGFGVGVGSGAGQAGAEGGEEGPARSPTPSQSPLSAGGNLIEVEKNLLAVLASAASSSPSVQEPLVAKGGCAERVVEILQARCMDSDLLRSGCLLLGSAAVSNPQTQAAICSMGGVQAVIGAALCFQGDPRVQADAATALGQIVRDSPSCQNLAAGLQGPEIILRAMTRFTQIREVQRSGCGALANFASGGNRAMQDSICGSAGIGFAAIFTAMSTHNTSGSVLAAACLAISAMVQNNDANRRRVVRSNGIRHITKAMAAVQTNKDLQFNGCLALISIAQPEQIPAAAVDGSNENGGAGSNQLQLQQSQQLQQEISDTLASEKATEKVVNAMACFLGDVQVLTNGCRVLDSFFALPSNGFLENARAIEILIAALNSHRASEEFQTLCLGTLRAFMAHIPSAAQRMASAGGIESVLESMKALPESEEIQVVSVGLIFSVVKGCPDIPNASTAWTPANIGIVLAAFRKFPARVLPCMTLLDHIERSSKGALESFVMCGGLGVTSALMNAYNEEQDVQACGARVVSYAFATMENCNYRLGESEIRSIVWAMGKFPGELDVQVNCYAVIRCAAAAGPRAIRVAICNTGAMSLIVGTLTSSKTNDEVHCAGCRALEALVRGEPEIQALFRMNSGLDVAFDILRSSSTSDATLAASLRLIAAATAGNTESQAALLQIDGPRVILAMMSAHINSPLIQEGGCLAITAMIPPSQPPAAGSSSSNSLRATVLREFNALGAPKAILDAAMLYEARASMQAAAFAVLAQIATAECPEAQEYVGAIETVKFITTALATFVAEAGVQESGYRLLESITENAPENRTKVLLSFEFETAAQALADYHVHNPSVQRAAFNFIAHVVYDNKRSTSCVSMKTVAPFLCSIPMCSEAVAEALEADRDENFCMFALACLSEREEGLDDSLRGALFSFIEKRAENGEIILKCLRALKRVNLDGITKDFIETKIKAIHADNAEIQKCISDLM